MKCVQFSFVGDNFLRDTRKFSKVVFLEARKQNITTQRNWGIGVQTGKLRATFLRERLAKELSEFLRFRKQDTISNKKLRSSAPGWRARGESEWAVQAAWLTYPMGAQTLFRFSIRQSTGRPYKIQTQFRQGPRVFCFLLDFHISMCPPSQAIGHHSHKDRHFVIYSKKV